MTSKRSGQPPPLRCYIHGAHFVPKGTFIEGLEGDQNLLRVCPECVEDARQRLQLALSLNTRSRGHAREE